MVGRAAPTLARGSGCEGAGLAGLRAGALLAAICACTETGLASWSACSHPSEDIIPLPREPTGGQGELSKEKGMILSDRGQYGGSIQACKWALRDV